MDNAIVVRVARALRSAGLVTLRFDFRGVGGSEGTYSGTGAEEEDVEAALDELARRWPDAPAWAAGYSFGAHTVCGLAARSPRIRRVIAIALPVEVYGAPALASLAQPGLLLFGGEDEYGTAEGLRRHLPEPPANLRVEEIPGADHFFRGRTPDVEERVRAFALETTDEP